MSEDDANLIVGALDSLGVALADHGHEWTEGERCIYEAAVECVRKADAARAAVSSTDWLDALTKEVERRKIEARQAYADSRVEDDQKFYDGADTALTMLQDWMRRLVSASNDRTQPSR